MFRRLRIKLTILYAALFSVALIGILATSYAAVAGNAQRLVREQMQATGAVFDRIWDVRFQQLQYGARLSVRDYGFRQAVSTEDTLTIGAALENLRERLGADLVFLVTPQGQVVGGDSAARIPVTQNLLDALEGDGVVTGVTAINSVLHQAVSAPLYAPDLLGWVIVAERLDQNEMHALEQMAAIPLHARALAQQPDGGWDGADDRLDGQSRAHLAAFINRALEAQTTSPGQVESEDGPAIALVKPLRSLDGAGAVLMLNYPLAAALAPYQGLFNTLIAIGVCGLALLVIGSWLLANTVAKPISTLEAAARGLQAGQYDPVDVRGRDEIARLAESFNAMAGAIRERERKITDLAFHDPESALPNRLALERRLGGQVHAREGQGIYMAAIGIDRFADVRAAIGYAHATALIRTLGLRLARLAPNAPTARLSSDVLALAFVAENDPAAEARMRALCLKLEQPAALDGQVVDVEIAIGVAPGRAGGEAPAALIERASVALDQARAARSKLAFFDEAAYGDPARNLSLMGEMRRALKAGDIHLVHQPKLDLRRNVIDGVETLVRWRHPSRGMISPDLFVPMAEETGHIRALTDWVLAKAIEEQNALAAAGWPLKVSVNISGRLLGDRDFAESAMRAVAKAAHPICFEITETAIIENPKVALDNIELFVSHGICIAIDDYGSGLSSLAYLKQLPANELKIDKLFIESLTNSQRDALLVRSTIDLAHGLGLRVTAEGVENPTAFALLAAMGCDMAQGYLVGRPCPAAELLTILNDTRRMEFFKQAAQSGVAGNPPSAVSA
jgi:diguanylate cyclase